MAQVVVYGQRNSLDQHRVALSAAVDESIMAALEYPPEKKFQRFTALDADDFVYPEDRGPEYTITETPKVNWGIRGQNAAGLSVGYRLNVKFDAFHSNSTHLCLPNCRVGHPVTTAVRAPYPRCRPRAASVPEPTG